MLLEEPEGAVDARVTGTPGRVDPLQSLGTDRIRNKQTIRWAPTWIWLEPLSFSEHGLNLPGYCCHHTGSREDGVGT